MGIVGWRGESLFEGLVAFADGVFAHYLVDLIVWMFITLLR